jgi:hypothetical protein
MPFSAKVAEELLVKASRCCYNPNSLKGLKVLSDKSMNPLCTKGYR